MPRIWCQFTPAPAWESPFPRVKAPRPPRTASAAWTAGRAAQGALRRSNWVPDDLGTNDTLSSSLIGVVLPEMARARAGGPALTWSLHRVPQQHSATAAAPSTLPEPSPQGPCCTPLPCCCPGALSVCSQACPHIDPSSWSNPRVLGGTSLPASAPLAQPQPCESSSLGERASPPEHRSLPLPAPLL